MIDKIISFGDSFMYGSDLPDCDGTGIDKFSKLTWPALCAKKLELDYDCHAIGSIGNQIISNLVVAEKCTNALVIINWSWIDRYDYVDANDKLNTLLPGQDTELSNFYYKNLHNEATDRFRNLCWVFTAHQYLNKLKIPFISSIMDTLLISNTYDTKNIKDLVQKDISWFPNDQTFLEWSRSNGYPESENWHPLEQAHQEAAKIWLPVYEKTINTYITTTQG